MSADHAPERHRDYFQREMQVGRRIVCQWSAAERWPEWASPPDCDLQLDSFEFRTVEDANRFNLEAMTSCCLCGFDSWEDAVQWVQEEPTQETRNVHEQFSASLADFEREREIFERRERNKRP